MTVMNVLKTVPNTAERLWMIKEKKHFLVQQLEAWVREKRQTAHSLIGLGAGWNTDLNN